MPGTWEHENERQAQAERAKSGNTSASFTQRLQALDYYLGDIDDPAKRESLKALIIKAKSDTLK